MLAKEGANLMPEQEDWRLLNDAGYLKGKALNPTDGEEITMHAPYLQQCVFCFEKVQNSYHQRWFVPEDLSCCICEECYNDFKSNFNWKKLDGWDINWEETLPQKDAKNYNS